MKTAVVTKATVIGLGLAMACVAASTPARAVTMRTGTVIPVTLDQDLSSDHSRKGDTFTVTVKSGYLGLPQGTQLRGVVRSAVAKTKDKPGALLLEFTRIMPPDSKAMPVDGSPVSLDPKSVTTSRDGPIVAKPGVKNKRLAYIGYGAGAGVLISVLGGGKDLIRNAVIGGGLGYLAGALDKSGQKQANNVSLKSGLSMGVLLHRPVTVQVNAMGGR